MEELQVHVREMFKLFGAEHPPHADIHGEPLVDVLGSRVAEGGGEVGGQVMEACLKPLGAKSSIYADEDGEPCVHVQRSRTVEAGGGAASPGEDGSSQVVWD